MICQSDRLTAWFVEVKSHVTVVLQVNNIWHNNPFWSITRPQYDYFLDYYLIQYSYQ